MNFPGSAAQDPLVKILFVHYRHRLPSLFSLSTLHSSLLFSFLFYSSHSLWKEREIGWAEFAPPAAADARKVLRFGPSAAMTRQGPVAV